MRTDTAVAPSSFRPVRLAREGTASAAGLAGFGALSYGTAAIAGIATASGIGLWYSALRKPPYQPRREAFGPVWSVLYGAIALSGWRAWKQADSPRRSLALGLWGAQLVFNGAWSWLFFGRHRPRAALRDELAILGSTLAYTFVVREVDRPAAWLMAPYIGWLSFAGLLNSEIVRLNPWIRR